MSKIIKFIYRFQNSLVAILLLTIVAFCIRLSPHPPLSEPLSFSTTYYDDNKKLIRMTLAQDDKYRLWAPLETISPDIINGLLLHEDQWFYYHPGFNLMSLFRAFWSTYISGSNKQGASTITMQLARMYYKINTRNIEGKLVQIFRAIELELMYSKHDILEAYLNYAPFGRNIEGIGAASLIYFDKSTNQINLPEALTLTVLPQSPTFRVNRKTGIAGKALIQARNRLFQRWQENYQVDDNIAILFEMPLIMRQPEQLPFIAPHFVNQIIQQNKNVITNKKNNMVITTLNSNLQKIIEQQVNAFIERNAKKGIYNASVLLVDNSTMNVKALIGSADYFNNKIEGQINGTQIKRSPGSTLKPFIYALGFDQGILHPMTILKDVETDFGFYTPENFDRKFEGPISVSDALIKSRNIPAVYVASKLKKPSFYQFLKSANIEKMASEDHYGLALVLGGGEITSQEMAKLYALIPNQGKWQPLKFIQTDKQNDSQVKQLISPAASFMIKDILLNNTRNQDILSKKQKKMIPIYWKTGTSWGFRDAWTAGGFKNYTLIVWLGNFNNSSNNAFVGVEAATPLFFNIIDAINGYYPNLKEPPLKIPNNIKKVDICLPSGNLVTKWCKVKGKTWFIPGVSPITIDTIFRPVMIDNKTGHVACPPYNPKTSHIEVFEYWPSDLAKIFAQAGIPKKTPPDSTHCLNSQTYLGKAPRITSPLKNVVYQYRLNNQNNEKMSLIADTDGEVKQLYWFIDNYFIGTSKVNQPLDWVPNRKGSFKLLAVDDLGRSDSRIIKVELIE